MKSIYDVVESVAQCMLNKLFILQFTGIKLPTGTKEFTARKRPLFFCGAEVVTQVARERTCQLLKLDQLARRRF
jgi:hypothetical protein